MAAAPEVQAAFAAVMLLSVTHPLLPQPGSRPAISDKPTSKPARRRRGPPPRMLSAPPSSTAVWPRAAAATLAALAAGVVGANGCFGVLDNTGDELADILGVDEVPPAAVAAVRLLQPVYEPLKAVSPSCTEALFPEFNEVNDWNDCSLLPRRVFWRRGAPPLLLRQTMSTRNMWQSSTGSAVWGGGIVLSRAVEQLGSEYWQGKAVLELGTGTGLGAISAAKLGAVPLATDRDPKVLELAAANAQLNGVRLATAPLTWGAPAEKLYERAGGGGGGGADASPLEKRWDVIIGADLTYNREAWPALFETLRAARTPQGGHTPALLSASERRAGELQSLREAMDRAGLRYESVASPMGAGYGRDKVALFWIRAVDAEPSGVGPGGA